MDNHISKITEFTGEYSFLSNYYHAPFRVNIEMMEFNIFSFNSPDLAEIAFPTVENFYQAFKAKNISDFMKIAIISSPKLAKKMGKQVELRSDWENIKDTVMLQGLIWKFLRNKELAKKLIETKDLYLEESNFWHDNYWGNCYCNNCKDIEGKNKLGKMLMFLRELMPAILAPPEERKRKKEKLLKEFEIFKQNYKIQSNRENF